MRRLLVWASLPAAALLWTTLAGCGEDGTVPGEGSDRRAAAESVLVVTLDTTRADHLGVYGCAEARTPVIDGLAREGAWFRRVWTTAPITLPAHTTMLTGLVPREHGVRDNAVFKLADHAQLLPEVLAERGLRTGAFVGSYVLDARYGLSQGFETYRGPVPDDFGQRPEVVERSAGDVVDDAIDWLSALEPGERFFTWVHFYDPHAPHDPPAEMKVPGGDDYDAEIALCDRELGRLLQFLAETGRREHTMVVVTADHGESFHEHREETHGVFVYDATMRVPLIMVQPGLDAAGEVAAPASLTDLPATILDGLGFERDLLPRAGGQSLLPCLEGDAGSVASRELWLESMLPYYSFRWHPIEGLVAGELKVIDPGPREDGGRHELYRLDADPGEIHSLEGDAAQLEAMVARLEAARERHASVGWASERELSADEQARMAALGYVSENTSERIEEGLPSAADRIGDLELRNRVSLLIQEGRGFLGLDSGAGPRPGLIGAQDQAIGEAKFAEARGLLDGVLEANPLDPWMNAQLGLLELSRGNHAAAIPPLEQALAGRPTEVSERYNLAICYARTGRSDWAEKEVLKIVTQEPRFSAGWNLLMTQYGRSGRLPEALFCAERFGECPGLPEAQRSQLSARVSALSQQLGAQGSGPQAPAGYPNEDTRTEGAISRAGD